MTKNFGLDQEQMEVIDDVMAEILWYKTSAERIRIAFDIWASTRNILITYLKNPSGMDSIQRRLLEKV